MIMNDEMHGHDCYEHTEETYVEAPCPACPDAMWQAEDIQCTVCGQWLQVSGHVHGLWLARADKLLLEDPEAAQLLDDLDARWLNLEKGEEPGERWPPPADTG
jgi:hypothetical protein